MIRSEARVLAGGILRRGLQSRCCLFCLVSVIRGPSRPTRTRGVRSRVSKPTSQDAMVPSWPVMPTVIPRSTDVQAHVLR